jgi:DNA-binding YbaB/EbfC family protein
MDMKQMMRQAQKMQAELAKAQDEIKDMTAEATAGGGMVTVVATGNNEIQSIKIDPAAVDPEDVEMLQDLIVAAVNEAIRTVEQVSATEMEKITGGLNIPGLM